MITRDESDQFDFVRFQIPPALLPDEPGGFFMMRSVSASGDRAYIVKPRGALENDAFFWCQLVDRRELIEQAHGEEAHMLVMLGFCSKTSQGGAELGLGSGAVHGHRPKTDRR